MRIGHVWLGSRISGSECGIRFGLPKVDLWENLQTPEQFIERSVQFMEAADLDELLISPGAWTWMNRQIEPQTVTIPREVWRGMRP